MATVTRPGPERPARAENREVELSTDAAITRAPVRTAASAVVALAAVGLALAALDGPGRDLRLASLAALTAWALAAAFVAFRRPAEATGLWMALVPLVGAFALFADTRWRETGTDWARVGRGFGLAFVPYAVLVLITVLPDGTIRGRGRRIMLVGAAVAAGIFGAVFADEAGTMSKTTVVAELALLGVVAVGAFIARCRNAGAVERARLQWAGWGAVVAAALALAAALVHALLQWPEPVTVVAILASIFVPLALALAAVERLVLFVDRLLVRTIEAGGIVLMVAVVYLIVVLGFGDAPDDPARRVLGLSMVAAAIAALLYMPARSRLVEFGNRRVYGERQAPDEPLQTFGARMSRAIPLDELLLQLAESLKKSMRLAAAEVWTGTDGVLECAASVPFREPPLLRLTDDEQQVVARAHVSGNAWVQVWLPSLLANHPNRMLRVVPMAHSGELLGLLVTARESDGQPFSEEEERAITELARQVALALHNSALDTALQASLDDLRVANEELRASRARIVATADQSRRQIERNLHDGAQQHLVALAVKLGLARQLVGGDPETVTALLEELRTDAQETLTQLRELAHGIYPPLLMDRGLAEALRAAANRSTLATDVTADVGRYPPDVEAAVYFCCLEAMQNAGKHAGADARVKITVEECDGDLCFEVADNGAGFDATSDAVKGHGFVNMADRLGAISGTLEVESTPGVGTKIRGTIPLSVNVEHAQE